MLPGTQVKTYVRVVFSKSTWLKGTIEKGTLSAVKEAQADFIVKANAPSASPFQVLVCLRQQQSQPGLCLAAPHA